MRRHAISLLATAAILAAPVAADAAKDREPNPERIPDDWKRKHGISLTKPGVAKKDTDKDGLTTWAEWRSGTDPRKPDSDRDALPDGAEDGDEDGLANAFELAALTDPGARDSDRDKERDGAEDPDHDHLGHAVEEQFGYLPLKRDSDGDGVADDAENPGVVFAVAGKKVTIKLAGGGKLGAKLTSAAEVSCDTKPAPVGAGVEGEGEGESGGDGDGEGGSGTPGEPGTGGDAPTSSPEQPTTEEDDYGYASAAQEEPPPDQPPAEEPPPEEPPVEEPPPEEQYPTEEEVPSEEEVPEEDTGADNKVCAALLAKGALVRSATVQRADKGLAYVTLELLAKPEKAPKAKPKKKS